MAFQRGIKFHVTETLGAAQNMETEELWAVTSLNICMCINVFCAGDGLHSFPIHRMCIINMAASDEAIINRLLYETMKVERKEFEGQRRSNESDIILHRQRLAQEHVRNLASTL